MAILKSLIVNGVARVIGDLTASKIIKQGGVSSLFLKADGSVDSTSYYHSGNKPSLSDLGAASANHTHSYLPLSGGNMTGDITMDGMNTNLNWNVDYLQGWARNFIVFNQHNNSSSGLVDVFHIGGVGGENGFEYAYIGTTNYNGNNLRFNKDGSITIGSGVIWHSNNDGTGSGLDADTVDGYHATYANNKPWGTIPVITTAGWMDVGKQFEFHFDNTTGSDYSTILRCTGNYSNIVDLPSKSGTLALTSQIPTSLPANGGNADTLDGKHNGEITAAYFSPKTLTRDNTLDDISDGIWCYINANNPTNSVGHNSALLQISAKQWDRFQLAFPGNNGNSLYFRSSYCASDDSVSWNSWKTIIDSGNYNNYAPKLDGTGASGTWNINITGNAATAASAVNADKLDGYHASQIKGIVTYNTWEKTTTSGIAWFPISYIYDSVEGSAIFIVRATAHSSLIFTVTKGYINYGVSINILGGGGSFNNYYAYIRGVRYIDGKVEIGLNALATVVDIAVRIVAPSLLIDLITELIEDTRSNSEATVVYTGLDVYNVGIRAQKFYGLLIGDVDWSNVSNKPTKVSAFENDKGYVTTDTTYSTATSNTLGLVKIGYTANGKNYPILLSNGQMYVNVPWTDTDTNTWRPITDSYSGTSSDTSLSQKGGKAIYDALINGYATSAGSSTYSNTLEVLKFADSDVLPNQFDPYRIIGWVNDSTGLSDWWSGITVNGLGEGYSSWQLAGHSSTSFGSHDFFFREADGDSGWRDWIKIITSDNISSLTVAIANLARTLSLDNTIKLYVHNNNELNFGGTDASTTIYFGYKAADSKAIPTSFIFGGSTGTATLTANGFIKKDSSDANVLLGGGGHKALSLFVQTSGDQSISGTKTFSGTIKANRAESTTGFFLTSDIRYKNIIENHYSLSDKIAQLPIIKYKWTDRDDDSVRIGSSALSVMSIIPELVSYDNNTDFYSLDYATLGAVAGISACKEVEMLKYKIKELELEIIILKSKYNG